MTRSARSTGWDEGSRTGTMTFVRAVILCWCLLGGAQIAKAQLRITGFDRQGILTWTNSVTNVVGTVEWTSGVTNGWQSDWRSLRQIPITNQSMSVAVPMFYRVLVSTNHHSGLNLDTWIAALGDGAYAPEGEPPVTINDIETTHSAGQSELVANRDRRRIMAHNITFKRILHDEATNFIHDCGYSFRLPYLPSTANPEFNAQTLEGGLFIWDGSGIQLDYGGAFQWVLNPWLTGDPKFGDVRVWTGFGTNEWRRVGFLQPDTNWHDVRIRIDFRTGMVGFSIDGDLYPFAFTATPRDGWGPETAARFQVEIISAYPATKGYVHTAHVRNWFWHWYP